MILVSERERGSGGKKQAEVEQRRVKGYAPECDESRGEIVNRSQKRENEIEGKKRLRK